MINPKIAGALFDFIGYLTTRNNSICVGAKNTVYQIHKLLEEWADMRDLNLNDADVIDWEENDRILREQYPELERLYKKKITAEGEYFFLRKLVKEHDD